MTTKKNSKLKIAKNDITAAAPVEPSQQATATSNFVTHAWWVDTVTNESWAYRNDAFTPDEIKQIIAIGTNANTAQTANGIVEFTDGVSQVSWIRSDIESNRWLFQRMAGLVKNLNDSFFNLDVNYIENLQFVKLEADTDGFIQRHTDSLYTSTGTRKLSFNVVLNDQFDGGDLLLHLGSEPTVLPNVAGSAYVYPAYVLREVTNVTSGVRYSLSGTIVGPRFK
jgi:hypothetical protein